MEKKKHEYNWKEYERKLKRNHGEEYTAIKKDPERRKEETSTSK
jgi:hypothetical protein